MDARRYIDASHIAKDILHIEPENSLIKEYLPVLAQVQREVTKTSMKGRFDAYCQLSHLYDTFPIAIYIFNFCLDSSLLQQNREVEK